MGSKVTITTDDQYKEQCDNERIWLDYVNITKVIKVDDLIYIDDGLVSLKVLEIVDDKSMFFFSFFLSFYLSFFPFLSFPFLSFPFLSFPFLSFPMISNSNKLTSPLFSPQLSPPRSSTQESSAAERESTSPMLMSISPLSPRRTRRIWPSESRTTST